MNADSHRAAKAANPPVLPWQSYDPSPWYGEDNPHVELPEYMIGVEQANNEENDDYDDDDEEEEIPCHDEVGTSNPRRRYQQEREDEDMSSLTERVDQMEVRQEEYWARNEARWEQHEINWNQFTYFNNAQWVNLNARLDERQHLPPPPH
ncbi:uncharacterized protein LOC121802432 [Salvia splendens]|uniref:uncharacterized protein LOC121802432 n=1 Tax=Salvia splendens TaxID=180675 RepID=UPI001C264128|nr:uncharacterized protein LOC121802432 [Salvia splendens]